MVLAYLVEELNAVHHSISADDCYHYKDMVHNESIFKEIRALSRYAKNLTLQYFALDSKKS